MFAAHFPTRPHRCTGALCSSGLAQSKYSCGKMVGRKLGSTTCWLLLAVTCFTAAPFPLSAAKPTHRLLLLAEIDVLKQLLCLGDRQHDQIGIRYGLRHNGRPGGANAPMREARAPPPSQTADSPAAGSRWHRLQLPYEPSSLPCPAVACVKGQVRGRYRSRGQERARSWVRVPTGAPLSPMQPQVAPGWRQHPG
jgi:hypothetical protein